MTSLHQRYYVYSYTFTLKTACAILYIVIVAKLPNSTSMKSNCYDNHLPFAYNSQLHSYR